MKVDSPCTIQTQRAAGVAIDNSVAAPPDVECLDDRIRVWVHTRRAFAGRIYAKNRAEYPACIQGGYAPLRTKKPHFEVTFGQCGMTSLRSVSSHPHLFSQDSTHFSFYHNSKETASHPLLSLGFIAAS